MNLSLFVTDKTKPNPKSDTYLLLRLDILICYEPHRHGQIGSAKHKSPETWTDPTALHFCDRLDANNDFVSLPSAAGPFSCLRNVPFLQTASEIAVRNQEFA